MFHRDEIDVLEEEMDEIYEQHDETLDDPISKMEDRIFTEQIETEEQAETDLIFKIGPHEVLAHMRTHEQTPAFLTKAPLTEFVRQQGKRDPLYETLFLWSKHVFAYARTYYFDRAIRREDVFRLYVNVKMIPIKFVSAQEGCGTDDVMSQEIAKKEAWLCLTFFERVLDSLQQLSFFGDEQARQFHQDGIVIERRVREMLV